MIALAGKQDRWVALSGVTLLVALSWIYLVRAPMPHHQPGAAALFWSVMMVAMMLPTALPAINLFGSFAAKRVTVTGHAAPTSFFVLGYAAVWVGYSIIAATVQGALADTTWITAIARTPYPAAGALLLAGAFQFSSFKQACLTQCRSPIPFLLAHWRDGNGGALLLGARHGSYCLGCCVALMGLMFVFGTMHLLWMGALSLFMLAEKIAPASWNLGRRAGLVFIVWGVLLLIP